MWSVWIARKPFPALMIRDKMMRRALENDGEELGSSSACMRQDTKMRMSIVTHQSGKERLSGTKGLNRNWSSASTERIPPRGLSTLKNWVPVSALPSSPSCATMQTPYVRARDLCVCEQVPGTSRSRPAEGRAGLNAKGAVAGRQTSTAHTALVTARLLIL